MPTISRRGAIKALAALAGGAAVTGAAGLELAQAAGATTSDSMRTLKFDLHARGLRSIAGGSMRSLGQQSVLSGILSHPTGPEAGSVHSAVTVVSDADRFVAAGAVGTFEQHTFQLADGSISGQGTAGHDGTGVFAVTGGTDAYHGARGSYTQIRDLVGFGGGTAAYAFTLLVPKEGIHGN